MPYATLWTGVGDHEYRTPFAQPYLDAVELPEGPQGERYYSFDWGDIHVVALDTNCIVPMNANEMGCDAATMVAWMEADLAATKAPWKIVTMHRPALATGKYGVFEEIPRARRLVREVRRGSRAPGPQPPVRADVAGAQGGLAGRRSRAPTITRARRCT